jgi:hypothetical protein
MSKTLFIIPTDAHYYKSVEMLKNLNTQSVPRSKHISSLTLFIFPTGAQYYKSVEMLKQFK